MPKMEIPFGPSGIKRDINRSDARMGIDLLLDFSGHPAASVPAGLTTDNLPVGMQIIGKRYGVTPMF